MAANPTEAKKVYTAEDVWQLALEDKHFELIDGELIALAPSKMKHGGIAGNIAALMGSYVLAHDLGNIYIAEAAFKMPDGSLLVPDVSFVSIARVPPENDDPGFEQLAPDLVVEVFSESNTKIEMQHKANHFFAAGTRQMWVVYPVARAVHVYTAADKVEILLGDKAIDGGDLLPGFKLPLKNIFKLRRMNS